ncbi:hypothetical protein EW146_g1728 [Bondarzewia mesenterica]|uniref:BD-FAE-like domain-containing protein n=1 Tax=Bondarzewia mesenterica TaxID=1095465 RepID=A0A4S4M572_9AGAM|nr:hypothetical protein EW146_g1728 [Bondarzewia mesenterica]
MEVIATLTETAIPVVLEPTQHAFMELLEARRASIEAVPRKTFKYGATDRHQLDVYFPSTPTSPDKKTPILFFIYGGGFNTGSRIFPAPLDLGYKNVGAFFASRGLLTIIPDYRLVPPARFPEPAEDVRDAISWVVQNAGALRPSTDGADPDVDRIFVLGHSAGAIYSLSVMLAPQFDESRTLLPRIRAAVLAGCLYHFKTNAAKMPVLRRLYGTEDETREKEPLGLLENAPDEQLKNLPELLYVEAERDPSNIRDSCVDFRAVLEKRLTEIGGGKGGWTTGEYILAKGHNHISPIVGTFIWRRGGMGGGCY